jgi:hypothetical protein
MMNPRDIVRECPLSHAVDGPCTNYVATYQMAGRDGPLSLGTRCSTCHQWIAPKGVAATHDRMGRLIPEAEAPPTATEREAQAERCHANCSKPDPDACPCQFIPDAETVAARIAAEAPR